MGWILRPKTKSLKYAPDHLPAVALQFIINRIETSEHVRIQFSFQICKRHSRASAAEFGNSLSKTTRPYQRVKHRLVPEPHPGKQAHGLVRLWGFRYRVEPKSCPRTNPGRESPKNLAK